MYENTTIGNYQTLLQDWLNNASKLNSEVEIIEDEEEIDIQSIEEVKKVNGPTIFANQTFYIMENIIKINELIKAVKQLDKNIKELNK